MLGEGIKMTEIEFESLKNKVKQGKDEINRLNKKIKSLNRYANEKIEENDILKDKIEIVAKKLEKTLEEYKDLTDLGKKDLDRLKSYEIAMRWCIKKLRNDI